MHAVFPTTAQAAHMLMPADAPSAPYPACPSLLLSRR